MEMSVRQLKDEHPKAFEKAFEEWQEGAVDFDWWDCTYDFWLDKLDALGIYTDKTQMRFSGFYSQGDGASFTGYVHLDTFWEAHGSDPKYLPVIELYKNGMLGTIHLNRSYASQYVHECTVYAERPSVDTFPDDVLSKGMFAGQDAVQFAEDTVEPILDDFVAWVQEVCRGYMREMFTELRDEYEYQTSVEAYVEWAEANDVVFEVDHYDASQVH